MMEQVTLKVNGMSCGHCVNAVEGSVGKLPGISKVKVELSEGKVNIEFNPNEVSLAQIKEEIDEQGYDVVE